MRLGDKLARFVPLAPEASVTSSPSAPVSTAPSAPVSAAPSAPVSAPRPSLAEGLAKMRRAVRASSVSSYPAYRAPSGPPPALAEVLPGAAIATTHGSAWVSATRHPPGDRHGLVPLGQATEASYRHLERLTGDPRLAGFDPRRALFLDIEATGLEHGAGTLAFLIGLGFFEGDDFRVEQVLLRDHDEEAAFLAIVWEAVERFPFLVSFNGKSFDLSVLQNRMVMHRMCSREESRLKLRPHLDLLHVSRAIYKSAWKDVRLQTLEAQVLGFVREDDMPGSMAPTCWFAWLRDGDPRPLGGIARHNRFDVLSMVALAGLLAAEAEPRADAGRRSVVALNLARLYLRRKGPAEAMAVLAEWPPLFDAAERVAALELIATAARRLGRHATEVETLEALVAASGDNDGAIQRRLERARRRLVPRKARV